jgi:diaminopimelate decarboxylase
MSDAFSLTPWQAEGFLEARGDCLVMDGVDLVALAEAEGTPIYVYSARRIRENAEGLSAAFRARHANTTVAYASKACSLMAVLRLIGEAGCALEVNSEGELWKARRAGFKDEAIVLNGVAKARSEIAAAIDPPIKAINVDSLFELERIRDVAAAANKRANVASRASKRYGAGHRDRLQSYQVRHDGGPVGPGAGDSARRQGAAQPCGPPRSYRLPGDRPGELCRSRPLHRGPGPGGRGRARRDARMHQCRRRAIGYYRSGTELEDFAEALLTPVQQALGEAVEIVTEPGRRLVSDAAVLLTQVENVKQRGAETWLYLDAGYHTLLEAFAYHWYFHALTANRAEDAETSLFRLVGPLCDNGDSFYDVDGEALMRRLMSEAPGLAAHEAALHAHLVRLPSFRELPAATGPGDLIAFLDTGAYSQDQLYAVNGRGRPKVLMIGEDGTPRIIRTADSFDDMLLNEVE